MHQLHEQTVQQQTPFLSNILYELSQDAASSASLCTCARDSPPRYHIFSPIQKFGNNQWIDRHVERCHKLHRQEMGGYLFPQSYSSST
nr:hypothetical protein Iba_chr05dCG6560 [Ipomoea batatas]